MPASTSLPDGKPEVCVIYRVPNLSAMNLISLNKSSIKHKLIEERNISYFSVSISITLFLKRKKEIT